MYRKYTLDSIAEQKLAFVDVILNSEKKEWWVQVRPHLQCLIYPGLTLWQIQVLPHTSVQIYTQNQWNKAITNVHFIDVNIQFDL